MERTAIIPTMTALSLCLVLVVLCVAGMTMASFDGVFDDAQLTDVIAYIRSIGS